MNDAMRLINQNAWRRNLLNCTAMCSRLAQCRGWTYGLDERQHLLANADRPHKPRQCLWLRTGRERRLVNAGVSIDVAEQPRRILGGLRRSEKYIAAGIQCVIECAADLFLQIPI